MNGDGIFNFKSKSDAWVYEEPFLEKGINLEFTISRNIEKIKNLGQMYWEVKEI